MRSHPPTQTRKCHPPCLIDQYVCSCAHMQSNSFYAATHLGYHIEVFLSTRAWVWCDGILMVERSLVDLSLGDGTPKQRSPLTHRQKGNCLALQPCLCTVERGTEQNRIRTNRLVIQQVVSYTELVDCIRASYCAHVMWHSL